MSDGNDENSGKITVADMIPDDIYQALSKHSLTSVPNLVGYAGDTVSCVSDSNALIYNGSAVSAIDNSRHMTVPLKVHYRDKIHEFSLPAECTLKELYQALSKQLADVDPNGEIMLERQAEATYEVNLPPGTY